MGRNIGPGPGGYALPPTVGYSKHDPSRYRYPAYSMAKKMDGPANRSQTPGPCYNVARMNQHGKASPPAYSLSSRPKDPSAFRTPGPGAHSPEKGPRMRTPRPPAYTMAPKLPTAFKTIGPGPLAYGLPSMLGPKVPNKYAGSAFTMSPRLKDMRGFQTPGPAGYQGISTNIYKNKFPNYTMSPRWKPMSDKLNSPGPAGYGVKQLPGDKAPAYSFGIRWHEATSPYITPDDHMPCKEY